MTKKPYHYISKPNENGEQFSVVRLHNRKLVLWKIKDGWQGQFTRLRMPSDKNDPPMMYLTRFTTKTVISLSDEAMKSLMAMFLAMNGNKIDVPFIDEGSIDLRAEKRNSSIDQVYAQRDALLDACIMAKASDSFVRLNSAARKAIESAIESIGKR